MAFTQADIEKARRAGRKEALSEALAAVQVEITGAEKELKAAAKGNFSSSTIERTKVRRTYAKKIAAAIRKIVP